MQRSRKRSGDHMVLTNHTGAGAQTLEEEEINEELELLVLASNGLWDVVPKEDAISIARTEEEPEAAARKLTETAFTQGSADNITCIVVRFHHAKDSAAYVQHKDQPKSAEAQDKGQPRLADPQDNDLLRAADPQQRDQPKSADDAPYEDLPK
ncbi:hypothetical protein Ancab_016228 [Ancistrocladus abbreviatus]